MRWIWILLAVLLTGCAAEPAKGWNERAVVQASVEHRCDKVVLVRCQYDRIYPDWVLLDVCGVRRFYEYGSWCEGCSRSWRERKR